MLLGLICLLLLLLQDLRSGDDDLGNFRVPLLNIFSRFLALFAGRISRIRLVFSKRSTVFEVLRF